MHLVTFDDAATPCRVTATPSTSGTPAVFVVVEGDAVVGIVRAVAP